MLVFTTSFPVSSELSVENFIKLAMEWVYNSKSNYNFCPKPWNGSNIFTIKDVAGNVELSINTIKELNTVAVRLKNPDKNIEWVSDFILSNGILSIQLQRNSTDNVNFVPKFHVPYIIKMILKNGYIGKDNELTISDEPIIITPENIDIISDVILNGSEYALPIVYVSMERLERYFVDIEKISRQLAGIAHVLVESDISISKILQEKTNGLNPYNGAVQIYFPKRFSKRFVPNFYSDIQDLRFDIINYINNRNLQMKIEDNLQYFYIVQTIQKAKRMELEEKHKQTTNDINVITDMYDALDKENRTLNDENTQLKSQLNDAKSKIMALQEQTMSLKEKLDEIKNTQKTPLLYYGDEKNLYDNEQYDIVLEILQDSLNTIIPDEIPTPRRRDIVESILKSNKPTGVVNEKVEVLKRVFKNPKLSDQNKTELRKIGICLVSDKTHYKFELLNDSRYYTTVAKTTSDKGCANKNVVAQIKRTFF